MWYMMYRTENGKLVRDILIKQAEGISDDEIIDDIENNQGSKAAEIARMLLD